jgi:RNA polymerase sigma-70 factor (ECF subfamily)
MHTTRIQLLKSLADGEADGWIEADSLYRPLIHIWLRRFDLHPDEIDDIVQEVMSIVVGSIGDFEHNGRVGAFRNWLRTSTVNVARNHLRKRGIARGSGSDETHRQLAELQSPESMLSQQFDRDHDRHVVGVLLDRLSQQFEPITLNLFQMHVVELRTADETASHFGVSAASVHTAKSRIMRRLRQEASSWLGDILSP